MNAQVVYFSNSGNNERLAKRIAGYYQIPVTPIVPVEAYPVNYSDLTAQAKRERFQHIDVAIEPISLATETDVLIVVSPIWYADLPRPVLSFIDQLDHPYKRVIFVSDKFMIGFGSCGRTLRKHLAPSTKLDKVAASSANFAPITDILGN